MRNVVVLVGADAGEVHLELVSDPTVPDEDRFGPVLSVLSTMEDIRRTYYNFQLRDARVSSRYYQVVTRTSVLQSGTHA